MEGSLTCVVMLNKLRQRARNIVAQAAQVNEEVAATALQKSNGNVKLAILVAAGVTSAKSAESLLVSSDGHLRAALSRINT